MGGPVKNAPDMANISIVADQDDGQTSLHLRVDLDLGRWERRPDVLAEIIVDSLRSLPWDVRWIEAGENDAKAGRALSLALRRLL